MARSEIKGATPTLGKVFKQQGISFGTLSAVILDICSLSTPGRLMLAVMDCYANEGTRFAQAHLAHRMGFEPTNTDSVTRYLRELVDAGFLEIGSGAGGGGVSDYFLKLPPWATANPFYPELFIAALKTPIEVNSQSWQGGKGKWANPVKGRPERPLDRLAWLYRRSLLFPGDRAMSVWAGFSVVEDMLLDLPPYSGRGGHKPAATERQGVPVQSGRAAATERQGVPVQSGRINSNDSTSRKHTRGKGKTTSLPLFLSGSEAQQGTTRTALSDGTPEGWELWKDEYQGRAGRPWLWTTKSQKLALEINAMLGEHRSVVLTQRNFLETDWWRDQGGKKGKTPWPLEALKKNLNDFLAPDQNLCTHSDCSRYFEGDHWRKVCNVCGFTARIEVLAAPAPLAARELTPDEIEAAAQGEAAWEKLKKAKKIKVQP